MMVSGVIYGFTVRDFWSAIWGSLLISIVNAILNLFVSDKKSIEKDSLTIEMKRTGKNRWE